MKTLLFKRVTLAFCFWVLIAEPAEAGLFTGPSDYIKQTLAAPEIVIGDRELDRDELAAFYGARDFRPVWTFSDQENSKAFADFLDSLDRLIEWHGLVREDYPLDLMKHLASANDDASKLKLELLVTDTLLSLAHDLHGDRVDMDDLYPGWNFHRADADIAADLAKAAATGQINEFIDGLTPKNPAYRQLAHALDVYNSIAAKLRGGNWASINEGPFLRQGEHDPRVAQLRARLTAEHYLLKLPRLKDDEFFDAGLQKAVLEYQTFNGLDADGFLGPKTLAALNVPLQTRIDQIRANMERWRHMPDDFPPAHYALVNIPDASLVIYDDSKQIYHGLVIVGQVDRKTPFIQSTIQSMVINPTWSVPAKIAREDILPRLREDPHFLEKLGITIRGNPDDPYGVDIDWDSISDAEFNLRLRQKPGNKNSLGRLKFDFPNDFAVYMHGTPHQELFKRNERDLSSGCVRLRDPEEIGQIILANNSGDKWDIPRIEAAIKSKKTQWVAVAKPMPLYFVYWTVFTDEDGHINFRNDIYNYDSFLMAALRGEDKPDNKPAGN